MLSDLSICLVQTHLIWEDITANLRHIDLQLQSISKPIDLIVLPEMFSTGFSMQPELFATEKNNETCINQMLLWAKKYNSVVCGSIMYAEEGHYYNRLLWVSQEGQIHHYNKAHLFRMGQEQQHYKKGNQQQLFELKGWKFAAFVCYDLRFPVWIRRSNAFNYDAMIFVANWPAKRNLHWQLLTRARAIENQSYVVAVNRTGFDANQIEHIGNSAVIEPDGTYALEVGSQNGLFYTQLSANALQQYRNSFPVAIDADSFQIKF